MQRNNNQCPTCEASFDIFEREVVVTNDYRVTVPCTCHREVDCAYSAVFQRWARRYERFAVDPDGELDLIESDVVETGEERLECDEACPQCTADVPEHMYEHEDLGGQQVTVESEGFLCEACGAQRHVA